MSKVEKNENHEDEEYNSIFIHKVTVMIMECKREKHLTTTEILTHTYTITTLWSCKFNEMHTLIHKNIFLSLVTQIF